VVTALDPRRSAADAAARAVMAPRLSVVVFVLNAVGTIRKALESVTAADQPPVELLVMDGGSTDGTVDVIREFEPKIAFWRSACDGGAVNALNEGVKHATGDIICLLPADDWFEPRGLQVVCQQFREDPQLEVLTCGTRVVHFTPGGELVVEQEFVDPRVLEFSMANVVRYPLTTARFVLRRLYNEAGEYDSSLRIANDLDFLIRILLRRPRIKVVPQLVYNYRSHAGSRVLGGNPRTRMELMQEFVRVAERYLPDPRMSLLERRALRGLHGRSSAHLAWALLRHGQFRQASAVLVRAVRLNWLFPLLVPIWYVRKPRRRGGHVA
jgi:glycosyltransferase involved in cell wall biosynthesis